MVFIFLVELKKNQNIYYFFIQLKVTININQCNQNEFVINKFSLIILFNINKLLSVK